MESNYLKKIFIYLIQLMVARNGVFQEDIDDDWPSESSEEEDLDGKIFIIFSPPRASHILSSQFSLNY